MTPSANDGPRPRIVVVEDEALVAEDLREMLRTLGYDVVGVADRADRAQALIAEQRPDVVLMDIHLRDGGDGVAVADEVRRHFDIPVVFATAYSDGETVQRAAATQPWGYVVKPFHARELGAALTMARYRHRADEQLRKMERWLSMTLASIGDAVIATDASGSITFLNVVAEAITGWSRAEVLGRHLKDVFLLQAEGRPVSTETLMQSTMASGVAFHLTQDYELVTRTGRIVPIDDSIAPIRDADGRIEGLVVIFRDRTMAKRALEERAAIERRLQEAQRLESLGVLAGGIAHDFNNLLTVIQGNASLGETLAHAGTDLGDLLRDISSASHRAAAICQQMLAYAGRAPRRLVDVDLQVFVHESVQLLRASMNKRVSLELDLASAVACVSVDEAQLQQVVMNLVLNGSDAIGDRGGRVTVRTMLRECDTAALARFPLGATPAPGHFVELMIEDTGEGMSPEVLPRIFEPFFTTKRTGRGLGLSAVLGIVREHGAALQVESRVGVGTVFRLLFPLKADAPALSQPRPAMGDVAAHLSGTLALVDDEPAVRGAVALMLRRFGFDVLQFESIEALRGQLGALPALQVAVLDMTLHDGSGADAAALLRSRFPELRLLFISGYDEADALATVTDRARTGFLHKPFDRTALEGALRSLLVA